MKRSQNFREAQAVAGGSAAAPTRPGRGRAPALPPIKTVYAVFKCHLDVGFADTQANVIGWYFNRYFPQAMDTAAALRRRTGRSATSGPPVRGWSISIWSRPRPGPRARMEQALAAGDLAWHGLPFNWETEMLDRSLLDASLGLSQSLDRRFGLKTIGAKMTDVPGHSRGIVGPLSEAGITFLNIGVNPASTYPAVPPLFRWRDPSGKEIVVMYHHHDYGGTVVVPGSDVAVSVQVRGDNSGPHSIDEIKEHLRRPGAAISGRKDRRRQPQHGRGGSCAVSGEFASGDAGDRRFLGLRLRQRSRQSFAVPRTQPAASGMAGLGQDEAERRRRHGLAAYAASSRLSIPGAATSKAIWATGASTRPPS